MISSAERMHRETIMDLARKEFLDAHRYLDRANIPRDCQGQALSMSQRVALLVERQVGAVCAPS
jgi:hypothetical protein